ncbi:MAG: hypothetical protein ACHQK9_19240 [Reyranellales bacterium]
MSDAGEIVGAPAIGEQAVVSDAMEAAGQNVDEEAANEHMQIRPVSWRAGGSDGDWDAAEVEEEVEDYDVFADA